MNKQAPYIAGPYVGGTKKFIGRVDILQKVQKNLSHHQGSAILLHGQRRIGKTSVLKELETNLLKEKSYHPIYFDLLGKARQSLEETLCDLANTINSGLGKTEKANLGNNPKTEFREVWLPNLLNHLNTRSLVLLFDEFDALDAPELKQISDKFFSYVRDLLVLQLQHLSFVFVIGRNINDLHDVALALCKDVNDSIHVSLLEKQDTEKLIGFSIDDNSLQWSKETIEKVWELTHGHPLLTQALCKEIWERFYHDENPKKTPVVTLKNIEVAIFKALKSNETGLTWLWKGLPPAERAVISTLASAGAEVISASRLESLLKNSGAQMYIWELQDAPSLLKDWDLIESAGDDGGYCFRVELLRRWVEKNKPLSQVQKELEKVIPVANDLYKAGQGFYNDNKLDDAVSHLRKAISINPNHNSANELLAEIYLAQEKPSDACGILEKLYKNQQSVAVRDRLIQAWLTLAQDNDDEDKQIRLYKQVLELDAEHIEAKNQLPKTWERQGDKASEAGDLGTALTAYRNAGIDDKGAEIEQKIRQQTQSYQQTQKELETYYKQKRLKWKLFPIMLAVILVIMGGFFWKYQQLQIQLEIQKVVNEQLTINQKEQKKEIKNLQEQFNTTKEWYEFISSLNLGDYWVMVGPYDDEQTTEEESKKITNQPPELPLEVIPSLFNNKWNVKIGKNYSQTDAERLMERIKELYLIKNVHTINPDCETGFDCLLKSLEKGNYRVIIGTYFKDKSEDAKRRLRELNRKYLELKVRKYRTTTKRNWRLYIGCYTRNSAERLRKWAAEDAKIAKEAYITECSGF